ncbi:glycosyltransferase family 2 protein [Lactiplantibacillus plantarum]|uniref:glycosyltransferase family 2 protein n=1 Tax=Lactiplantibacillus plantarum TaxID=1590 RepID=UPI00192D640F|nr:glycosyltransferase family 2 protein [Lactiplantibacillus plantarum]QRA40524.1 glycosyltransferase family 2 protein [Lactiplantibacillus plantarum]
MNATVCAIVVTYNRSELLKKCLSAIKNQSVGVTHIVVIDNHSTDATETIMKSMASDQVLYNRLDDNYGGAGGFKRGISYALDNTHDQYFWIMDDDTMPTSTALENLLHATLSLSDFGFLTANTHWKDGTPMNVPPIAQNWSVAADKGLIRVQEATFVSLFVERKKVEKVGLPFEEFFIWHDDTEFTTRLSKLAPGYFVTKALVVHESAGNNAPLIYTDSSNRISRYYYLYRNEMYICKKHKGSAVTLMTFLRDLFVGIKVLIVAPDHRAKRSFTVLKGTFSGLVFRPRG